MLQLDGSSMAVIPEVTDLLSRGISSKSQMVRSGLCTICAGDNNCTSVWSSTVDQSKPIGDLLWTYVALKVPKVVSAAICFECLKCLQDVKLKIDTMRTEFERNNVIFDDTEREEPVPEQNKEDGMEMDHIDFTPTTDLEGDIGDEEKQEVRRVLGNAFESLCRKHFKYKKKMSVLGHLRFEVDGKSQMNVFVKEILDKQKKKQRPFKCKYCGLMFKKLCSVVSHEKSHTRAKTELPEIMKGDLFQCSVCNKTFKVRKYWKRHMTIHSDGRRHQCQYCGKGFTTRAIRSKHEQTHVGDKPHQCEICGKKMTQKSTLKTHMLTHAAEKPYKCHICGKGCVKMYELQCHLRMHTGERPYQCRICTKGFVRNYQLQYHLKTHHIELKSDSAVDNNNLGHYQNSTQKPQQTIPFNISEPPYVQDVQTQIVTADSQLSQAHIEFTSPGDGVPLTPQTVQVPLPDIPYTPTSDTEGIVNGTELASIISNCPLSQNESPSSATQVLHGVSAIVPATEAETHLLPNPISQTMSLQLSSGDASHLQTVTSNLDTFSEPITSQQTVTTENGTTFVIVNPDMLETVLQSTLTPGPNVNTTCYQ